MHDLVIRGGTVVDGSGGEPFVADVAVDGDKIAVEGVSRSTAREAIVFVRPDYPERPWGEDS